MGLTLGPYRLLMAVAEVVPVERIYYAMGTVVRFVVYHEDSQEALEAIRRASALIQAVHDRMSVQEPSSTLSRWNQSMDGREVELDALTAGALEHALQAMEQTEGRFDPTVGAAVRAHEEGRQPIPQAERMGLWLPETRRLLKPRASVMLDLGGSAKGWAVDRAVEVLLEHEPYAVLVNAGGDLRVWGRPPGTEGWQVGIRHPWESDRLLASWTLTEGALATSGGAGGIAVFVDPRDLRQVSLSGSVSVLAPTCGQADAFSTALAVEPSLEILPEGTAGYLALQRADRLVIEENFSMPTP